MALVNGVYRPDFQADTSLPQWQQMNGEQQAPDAGATTTSFVDMLKKRMGGNRGTPIDKPFSLPSPSAGVGHEGLHTLPGAGGAAKGGGGMQSL